MESRRQRAGIPRGAAAGLAAFGVLVGLLGMHVLGLHGVQREAVQAMPGPTWSHHHGAEPAGAIHSHASAPEAPTASAGCCDHGHGMDALMLCVALVVAVGALVAAARSGRTAAEVRRLVRRPGRPPRRPTTRAGPAYVLAFSVIRC